MTSAYILIAAILVLGGLIAALGDRIGSNVGKKRLRLFNLRPKQTAIVVTILTGTVISASTLGILFGFSGSLRKGVFQLDEILKRRRQINAELEQVTQQKKQVEEELRRAEMKQIQAAKKLNISEQELKITQSQLKKIATQTNELRTEVLRILTERKDLIAQKIELIKQREELRKNIESKDQQLQLKNKELQQKEGEIIDKIKVLEQQENQLQILTEEQKELQVKINTRDEKISQLDQNIALKNQELAERESRLLSLEKELLFLQREVAILDQYYQTYQELREKQIALLKGQVLAVGLFQIINPEKIQEPIDELLRQANRIAIEALDKNNYAPDQRLVQITESQVEQIKQELQSGNAYFVRIISAGNYVKGEKEVRVFADISPNQKIYNQGQIIATVAIDPDKITETELQEKLDFLLAVSQFRARSSGVLGTIQIGDGNLISVLNLINQIQENGTPIDEIRAIASQPTYTSGPLIINLIVLRNGEEVLRL
jgi:uncharacterized protein (DUF3084 family)